MSKPSRAKILMSAVSILTVTTVALVILVEAYKPLQIHHSGPANVSSSRVNSAPAIWDAPGVSAEKRGQVRQTLAALPLAFEPNVGQTDPQVKYMARGNGYTVFLTPTETVFALSSTHGTSSVAKSISREGSQATSGQKTITASLHLKLVNGNSQPEITGESELPGVSNYYVGNDPSKWQQGVKHYGEVSYHDVYPGVGMKFHGQQQQAEFDFVVEPKADSRAIRLGVSGAQRVSTDASGNVVLASAAGDVLLHKPIAYQQIGDKKRFVDAKFSLRTDSTVGLILGQYDRSRELVVDPTVSYATYLGGLAEDDAFGIAVDSTGAAYVTGETKSSNFPTTSGSYSQTYRGVDDVFVTKVSADGSSLVFSTYIGGTGDDSGNAIEIDGSGNVYVAGGTTSTDFPTTSGAFQSTGGGATVDAFILELASTGAALKFSTYLGGSGDDVANGIAIDTTGVYIVGSTSSTDFPVVLPALQGTLKGNANGFVTKLNTSGSAPLLYSTYLGGGSGDVATAVAVDGSNQAYVTGSTSNQSFPTQNPLQPKCGQDASGTCNGGLTDAFISVFKAAGNGFVYSTFLGGSGNDQGLGIAVDSAGDAYVTGFTQSSTNFPLMSAAQTTFGGGTQDAFVTAINSSGSALLYSTYLGGEVDDGGVDIAVDGNKNAYITGGTDSTKFPITSGAPQTTLGGGNDAFVSEFSASGTMAFSTYLGGSLNEDTGAGPTTFIGGIAVDAAGSGIYVAGNTASTDFPTSASPYQKINAGGTDAFVVKYGTGVTSNFTVANGSLSPTSGSPGVSATATITVTSVNAFSSAVTLTCAVSPVVTNGPTCNFTNPGASVTPPANGTITSTLNVATVAASSAKLARPGNGHAAEMFLAMILPVFGIATLGLRGSDKSRKKLLGIVVIGLILTSLLLMPACGGSGSSGGGSKGTPAGAYTITVTGTSGSATATGTPALTLTVN